MPFRPGVVAILLTVLLLPHRTRACSVFVVVRDGRVFFCNNEDFTKVGHIWFTVPEDGKLGRINFGFESDGFAQRKAVECKHGFIHASLSQPI